MVINIEMNNYSAFTVLTLRRLDFVNSATATCFIFICNYCVSIWQLILVCSNSHTAAHAPFNNTVRVFLDCTQN